MRKNRTWKQKPPSTHGRNRGGNYLLGVLSNIPQPGGPKGAWSEGSLPGTPSQHWSLESLSSGCMQRSAIIRTVTDSSGTWRSVAHRWINLEKPGCWHRLRSNSWGSEGVKSSHATPDHVLVKPFPFAFKVLILAWLVHQPLSWTSKVANPYRIPLRWLVNPYPYCGLNHSPIYDNCILVSISSPTYSKWPGFWSFLLTS